MISSTDQTTMDQRPADGSCTSTLQQNVTGDRNHGENHRVEGSGTVQGQVQPLSLASHHGTGDSDSSKGDAPLRSPAGRTETNARPSLLWSTSLLQPISEEEVLDMMEGRDLKEIMSCLPPCQCDACVLEEGDAATIPKSRPSLHRQSSWKKIRSIVRWSPFIQVFKKHRYPWIQLAGHQGNFQAGEAGCVLKKLDKREHQSLQRLMGDSLQPYVPKFKGVVDRDGEQYVQLQDLLCEFTSPCVMDVKMGVRTFLETEILAAKHNPKLRKDMYKKMVEVDPHAPTEEEHAQKAVTKQRYMQWRDDMSSSVNLGFRIEGIKNCDGTSNKDFKKTKTRDSVTDAFRSFFGDSKTLLTGYLQRLQAIAATQESSEFFQSHEVIGSSLLFVHDNGGTVGVWMIDFGKTQPLPSDLTINHRHIWEEGNHEDGYLFGVDNIISILQDLQASVVE